MASLADGMAQLPVVRDLIQRHGPPRTWPAPGSAAPRDGACPTCGGQGFVYRVPPLPENRTLPGFGKASACDACHGSETPEERAERLWRLSGITGPERGRCTFAGFDLAKNPTMREAFDAATLWGEGAGPPFLVLAGQIGVGKTHLAVAAAQRCVEREAGALYLIVPDWLDSLRATQRPRPWTDGDDRDDRLDVLMQRAKAYPCVVFDDLGADRQTDFAREKLYQVLNDRWRAERATLITTNAPADTFDERLQSRMQDTRLSRVVGCRGADMRRTGGE